MSKFTKGPWVSSSVKKIIIIKCPACKEETEFPYREKWRKRVEVNVCRNCGYNLKIRGFFVKGIHY